MSLPQVKCDCNFEGANKTVSQLPTCKDEPDDPKAAKWCSLWCVNGLFREVLMGCLDPKAAKWCSFWREKKGGE